MSRKVFNMQGGSHSAAALSAFLNAMYGSSIANGLEVTPTGSAGLAVTVTAGTGNINTSQGFGRMIQLDPSENVTLTAASAANPRNDLIVAYIDMTVTPTQAVVDNTNDIFKLKAVAGSPAATPVDPTASQIQASVGAGNPYIILGRVRVNTSATSITAGNITDLRKMVQPLTNESSQVITTGMIKDAQVTAPKLDFETLPTKTIKTTETLAAGQIAGGVNVFTDITNNVTQTTIVFNKKLGSTKTKLVVGGFLGFYLGGGGMLVRLGCNVNGTDYFIAKTFKNEAGSGAFVTGEVEIPNIPSGEVTIKMRASRGTTAATLHVEGSAGAWISVQEVPVG